MAVPAEIRAVPRPVNTIVDDSGTNSPKRYAVRQRASSKYIPGGNPQPKNGKVIGHIIDYKYVPLTDSTASDGPDMLSYGASALVKSVSADLLSDLLNIPLIIYRRYEALIMDAFHSRGMEPDLFCVCDDPRGAMLWAKEGLATAIFPQSMSSLCQGLRIQPLAESDLETQIAVIWKKGRNLSPLLQDFVDACMESIL